MKRLLLVGALVSIVSAAAAQTTKVTPLLSRDLTPEPAQVSVGEATAQAGADGVYSHTRLTGVSNRKAKAAFGFNPRPLAWMDRGQA